MSELFQEYADCLAAPVPPPAAPREPLFIGAPGEEWRAVVGYEGVYEVSDRGNLRSGPTSRKTWGRRLRPSTSGRGYPMVNLRKDGASHPKTVHSIVAAAFLGPRPPGLVIDHLDADRMNAAAANLEYVTQKENSQRAGRMGLLRQPGWVPSCSACGNPGHNAATCGRRAAAPVVQERP